MKAYYFELVRCDNYEDLGAFIPDGSNKKSAENKARKWMKEHNVNEADLVVNSLRTNNILDIITISL